MRTATAVFQPAQSLVETPAKSVPGKTFHDALRTVMGRYRNPILSSEYIERFRRITEILMQNGVGPGSTVADIGAWPGVYPQVLVELGYNVIAVDIGLDRPTSWSPSSLLDPTWSSNEKSDLTVRQICMRYGIKAVDADITKDKLGMDNSVDAIVLSEVIEHIWRSSPEFALLEMRKALKPGGILLITTPNLLSIRKRISFLLGQPDSVVENPVAVMLKEQRLGHSGHLSLYSASQLQSVLTYTGFEASVEYGLYPIHREVAFESSNMGWVKSGTATNKGRTWFLSRLVQKLCRSPRSYFLALVATGISICENRVPQLQQQMYLIARSVSDSEFAQRKKQLCEQVVKNDH